MSEDMTPEGDKLAAATEQLKKYGPTAGVAIVTAIIAANLAVPDAPDMPKLPELPAEVVHAEKHPRHKASDGTTTRLVSCGLSTDATVAGDDLVGLVTLGPGASGTCTLLFSQRWEKAPTCLVEGGIVASVNHTDLVVGNIAAEAFAYRCAETP